MMLRHRAFSAVAIVVVEALVLIACKEDVARTEATACERTYVVCKSVPAATSEEVTACAHTLDGPCGTVMRRYLQCVTGKCDDAGVPDQVAIQQECSLIFEAYRSCASSDAGTDATSKSPEVPTDSGALDTF